MATTTTARNTDKKKTTTATTNQHQPAVTLGAEQRAPSQNDLGARFCCARVTRTASQARIGSAIETLLQICTFSDWTLYINQVQERNFRAVPVMLGIFAALAGLAIMNMITGVIVHAAFTVLNLADKREKRLIGLKNTLYETKASIFQHIHSERLTEVKRKLAVPASEGYGCPFVFVALCLCVCESVYRTL